MERLRLLPTRQRDEIQEEEIDDDQQERLVHDASGRSGLAGGQRQPLGGHDQLPFVAAHVADLDEGHADDAEEVGGVGGQQVGLDHAQHLQHEGGGGAHHADVQAAVEKVLLVFHEAQLERGRQVLPVDLD